MGKLIIEYWWDGVNIVWEFFPPLGLVVLCVSTPLAWACLMMDLVVTIWRFLSNSGLEQS
jgi:hypothetical protein